MTASGVPESDRTAVVIPVRAVEPVVSSWRERFDSSAAQGMPAHITVLYPFLPVSSVTGEVLGELRALCATLAALVVRFARTGRFPGVLYLVPEPADGLRELTGALCGRWPDLQPYGGRHDEVVPHLTVAYGDDATLDAVEAELAARLPLDAVVPAAWLYGFDGTSWQPRAELPFRRSHRGR